MGEQRDLYGLLAEFNTPGELMHAAEGVRDAGFKNWDCYSPFPVHGLDRAMGLRDTRLPWVVLIAGITGTTVAVLMQWWMNAVDYKLIIGGKPFFSLPSNIPVAFEVTILFAAISAFASMFLFNNLPKLYHPVFRSKRFKRVTTDGFFISIEKNDPRFDEAKTDELLRSLGSANVERLED
ncbi:MAG: DUF3341 domain-containing protein [bacterium]|nr:DUF3341 domain-containing protein [bacterium]